MSSGILNNSMRSGLLSLRETVKQQNLAQLRMSSGLKVNSAIDNPASFYTAQSLNYRANDLATLLNDMDLAISTVKTASTTIETAGDFLNQMASIASQTINNAHNKQEISLEILIENGFPPQNIATNKDELIAKMASAKSGDVIVAFGTIEMGDTSLSVKGGVTLAGTQYLLDNNDYGYKFKADKKSIINFDRTSPTEAKGIILSSKAMLSDLEINLSSEYNGRDGGAIYINNANDVKLQNLNLSVSSNRTSSADFYGAISNLNKSTTELHGNINIKTSGGSISGIIQQRYFDISTLRIAKDANVNIETSGDRSTALSYGYVYSEGNVKIKTAGMVSHGMEIEDSSTFSGNIDVHVSGNSAYIIRDKINLLTSAKLMFRNDNSNQSFNNVQVYSGAIIGEYKNGAYNVYEAKNDNILTTSTKFESNANYNPSSYTYEKFLADITEGANSDNDEKYYISNTSSLLYNKALDQYNASIKDGSYKELNLLLANDLKVNFNEYGSTGIEIYGFDASSENLGLKPADWKTLKNIEESLAEISFALNNLNNINSSLGNYYSTVSIRKDFTENLINILNEGTDKLTLADINEEAASTLALETRQQLAINSLSLASQAAQSILKLF